MKNTTGKLILTAALLAVVITVLSFLTADFKIEIHNPDASIVVKISENKEQREIPAKRFEGNTVFANMSLKDMLSLDKIYLYILGSPGTQTLISDIQLSIGNTIIRTYDQMNETAYIETKNLLVDENSHIATMQTENAYIFLYKPSMKMGAIKFCLKIFLVSFVLLSGILVLLQKKSQIVKQKAEQLLRYIKTKYPSLLLKVGVLIIVPGMIYFLMIKNSWISCPWVDAWELLFFMEGFLLLSFQLRRRTKHKGIFIICEVLLAVFLFMSVFELTTYLTVDEESSILEQSNFQSSDFRHWIYGESYMNFSIMGTIWKFVPESIIEQELISELQMGKLLHWFCGIILLGVIAGQIEKHLADTKKRYDRAVIYTMLLVTALVLPVTLLALKNYNYDMFSMLFGVLGLIEICIYAENKTQRHGIAGVLFLTCGMLEKMIVFPVWYIGIAIAIFVKTKKATGRKAILKVSQYVVITFAMILLFTYEIEGYTLGLLREVSPIYGLRDTLIVLLQIPGMGFRAVGDIFHIQLSNGMIYITSAILYILGEAVVVGIMRAIYFADHFHKNYKIYNRLFLMPQIIFLGLGILNRFIFVVDATQSFGAAFIEYSSIFTEAFPTALLILIVLTLVLELKTEKLEYYGMIQFLVSCVLAVMYVLTGWTSARYADLYLLTYALLAVIVVSNVSCSAQKIYAALLVVAGGISSIELAGSQPAFTYFIPYWGVIPAQLHGRELAAYWGENWGIMLDVMDDYCKENGINESDITLNCSYPGKILTNDTDIQIGQYWWRMDGYAEPTEQDYFVFETRSLKAGQITYGLPEDVDPVIVVKYHGAVTARIYRGDTLTKYFEQYED